MDLTALNEEKKLAAIRVAPSVIITFLILGNIHFVHLHKLIGIPSTYFASSFLLLIFLLTTKYKIPVRQGILALFLGMTLFILFSGLVSNAGREAAQLTVDFILAVFLAIFIKDYHAPEKIFTSLRNFYALLVIAFIVDAYTLGLLNQLSYMVSDMKAGGTSTYLVRITGFTSNPNWLAGIFFFSSLAALKFGDRDYRKFSLCLFVTFLIQSKTYIALHLLVVLWELPKINKFLKAIIFISLTYASFNSLTNLFNDNIANGASYINRVLIYEYVANQIGALPSGVLESGTEELKIATSEDTVPSFLVFAKLFGWIITGVGIFYMTIRTIRKSLLLTPCLLAISFTQSWVSVSGVAFYFLFLVILEWIYVDSR